MNDKAKSKRFGIRCTLPADDPMSAPHLLGPDWVAERWYATEQERDESTAERQGPTPGAAPARVVELALVFEGHPACHQRS